MEKILDFIINLLLSDGIIISVATFITAQIIKGFKKIPKEYIPFIGGVLGIILGIIIPNVFPNKDVITSGILGLALGWASTGGYETIKQLKNKEADTVACKGKKKK